jgi:hypothetical protein
MATPVLPHSLLARFLATQTAHPGRLRAVFVTALAVVVVVISLKYAAKIAKPGNTGQQSRSAFLRWRTMILEVHTGTNIYVGKNEYPNPPVMAIILWPFVVLPPVLGAMTWFYTKVILAVLAGRWIFRLTGPPGDDAAWPPLPDAARAAAILLTLPALLGDLSHNNINIFILFLIAAALELYRRQREIAAGLVVGLAIACKVTPVLFLAYFIWKRAGRVVGGCVGGLVAALVVVPGLVYGPDRNTELLTDWYKLMIERPVLKGEITTEHPNQALPGFIYRLFTHSPSFIAYAQTPDGDIPVPAEYHNLVDIGRPAAWWVVKGWTAALALAVMVLCRAPRSQRQGWQFAAECGLIVLAMLLLSERTWKHHAVTLLLPITVLAYAVVLDFPRWIRATVVAILVAAGGLMAVPGLFGTRVADLALVYGTHTLAFLLLTAGICLILVQGKRGSIHQPSPSVETIPG